MDNKITKKRLSNLFSYEWIVIIVAIVAVVILWEFIFTVSAVRLSVGQKYKILYDLDVESLNNSAFLSKVEPHFSYDVIELESEQIQKLSTDMLTARLAIQDGDALFSSTKEQDGVVRAKSVVDKYAVYNYERLLSDAKTYLTKFLKDDFNGLSLQQKMNLASDYENLSGSAIDGYFVKRMTKDNRFRTQDQIADGKIKERARIKRLCQDVCDFEKLLNYEDDRLFFRYTKCQQQYDRADEGYKENFLPALSAEKENGRENAIYGLNLNKLPLGEGKAQSSQFFTASDSAEFVTILVFDFKGYQPDLQFESITFIVETVRFFSDILN